MAGLEDFVGFEPIPGMQYGTGEAILPDKTRVPLYSPELAAKFDKRPITPQIGAATDIETPGAPVANGKAYEGAASKFLKESGGQEGKMQTTPDGKMMVVEPHPAAPERGLPTEHPGVTVREPKISPEEDAALGDLTKKYPNLTKEGLLAMFQHEGGYDPNVGLNPGAVNPKSGAAGVFQLMPSQAQKLGMGDITKMSAADQIRAYDEYLKSHGAPHDISDADLGLAQAAPAFMGKPDDTLVYRAGSPEARDNAPWRDANGNVTVGSIKAYYGGQGGGTSSSATQPGIEDTNNPNVKITTDTKNITTNEAGVPYSNTDREALFKRSQEHADALAAAYAPVIDAQAALQERQLLRQQQLQQMQDDAATKEQAARDIYEQGTQKIQQATNDVLADQAPAPFGGNVFASVLASIAQGMGAYAAAINHTSNFAADAINSALNRENQRWQQNLLLKKYKVEQAKDLNTNQWHDYQGLRLERETQQRMLIDHELQQQMTQAKGADTQKALALIQEDNRNKTEELNAERERLARGKVQTQSITERKAVNTGAVDEKTYQAYMQGKPHNGLYGRAALDSVQNDMKSLAEPLGLNFDPNSATPFTPKEGAPDLVSRNPVTGSQLGPFWSGVDRKLQFNKDKEEAMKKVATQTAAKVNTKLYMVSGGQINEAEAKRTAEEFQGKSRADQIASLNQLWKSSQNKIDELETTYPGMQKVYDSRRKPDQKDYSSMEQPVTP